MKIRQYVVLFLVALMCSIAGELTRQVAYAHTGSPAFTTFSSGQVLTHTDLNNNFSHLHNTLTGAIADVNVSGTAAIQHSKLQRPALVSKAFGVVNNTTCPAGSPGTSCTVEDSSQVNWVKSTASNGIYDVDLSYVPSNANFAVLVTPITTNTECVARAHAAGAVGTRDFEVQCLASGGGAAPAQVAFQMVVFDT